jgi:hypothetical protein
MTQPTDGMLTGDDLNRLMAVAAEMDRNFHDKLAAWEYGVVVEKVIAENGSLADVKITFREDTP